MKRFRTSTCPKYEELILIFGDTIATSKEVMASTQDMSDNSDSQNELHLDDVTVDGESSGLRNHHRPRDPISTESVHCVRSQSKVLELADAIRSLTETNQARNNIMMQ